MYANVGAPERPHEDLADLAGGQRLAVLVAGCSLGVAAAARAAAVGGPLVAGQSPSSPSLAGAVGEDEGARAISSSQRVDDPLGHLRPAVDQPLSCEQVAVSTSGSRAMRCSIVGHHHRERDPVALDELDGLRGVELLHDDDAVAVEQGQRNAS